jgi:aldose sugar dehydrogenase
MFDSVVQMLSATSMIILLILLPIQPNYHNSLYSDALEVSQSPTAMPTINDTSLKVDTIFRGLNFPTSMAFLAPNDILVLEKNNGTVQRIVNGRIQAEPLINVSVANKGERGMLGIAIANN